MGQSLSMNAVHASLDLCNSASAAVLSICNSRCTSIELTLNLQARSRSTWSALQWVALRKRIGELSEEREKTRCYVWRLKTGIVSIRYSRSVVQQTQITNKWKRSKRGLHAMQLLNIEQRT